MDGTARKQARSAACCTYNIEHKRHFTPPFSFADRPGFPPVAGDARARRRPPLFSPMLPPALLCAAGIRLVGGLGAQTAPLVHALFGPKLPLGGQGPLGLGAAARLAQGPRRRALAALGIAG